MNQLPGTLASARLTVEPPLIASYADLTQDFNPIHLDPAFAAKTPMGGLIAHGTMSIGLIWQSLEQSLGAAAFADADLDIRFVKPVRLGETLVAGGRLRADDPRTYDVWVRAEQDDSDRLIGSLRLAAPLATGATP
ncbi:MaoC family dehydratase [Variovorax ginsengisoli]|uniref:MaoC family dehydratase n=1 Tax=Variovorax ginsengisoli TaxID=363844 RepID=A0ABT8SHG2_9BURK|nr:MaoC family dehydratase [Variovorax ginsengisoli]MDN8618477.1 MaoC family dehydratase [Variovorax ginsengisoli]MDO1537647.1 MaoC family dehydratase [Variovorax ginsengisoli]